LARRRTCCSPCGIPPPVTHRDLDNLARITATVGAGREGLLDIERQAELGGRIHGKGVPIVGGYLADTYAADKPLALTARLVFEQSYDEVNEKIEGFFDTCATTGLTGEQGVILPAANVEHHMLREDVVEAAGDGRFRIYAVRTVDDALEIVTDPPTSQRSVGGRFGPEESHARVDARLRAFADTLRNVTVPEPSRDRGTPMPRRIVTDSVDADRLADDRSIHLRARLDLLVVPRSHRSRRWAVTRPWRAAVADRRPDQPTHTGQEHRRPAEDRQQDEGRLLHTRDRILQVVHHGRCQEDRQGKDRHPGEGPPAGILHHQEDRHGEGGGGGQDRW
jgi:hypothetical protein